MGTNVLAGIVIRLGYNKIGVITAARDVTAVINIHMVLTLTPIMICLPPKVVSVRYVARRLTVD